MTSPETSSFTRHPSIAAPTAAPTPGANSSIPDAVPLPPPETFDFLPPLQDLLSRLLLPSGGLQAPASASPVPGTTQDTVSKAQDVPGTAQDDTDASKHLDIQELGAAAGAIKVKIQKARLAVKNLPDMERSLEDQRDEIEELEGRIEKMRGMLRGLGGPSTVGTGV